MVNFAELGGGGGGIEVVEELLEKNCTQTVCSYK